jgi:hypothetical protein
MARRNLRSHPSHVRVCHCRAFSHPDCTVGAGIPPAQPSPLFLCETGRGLSPPVEESHLAPKALCQHYLRATGTQRQANLGVKMGF